MNMTLHFLILKKLMYSVHIKFIKEKDINIFI